MKKLIIAIAFLLGHISTMATNYYFDAVSGNDANSGLIGFPWQTITKFNSVFATRAAGDFMLFNRGNTFVGMMILTRSGTVGNPITIGAYGTGANPIITSLQPVTGWTSVGTNLWETSSAASTLAVLNEVLIDGVNTAMGRTPNALYIPIDNAVTNTTITASGLTGLPNFTGGELVIRKTNWITDRCPIVGQTGNTISYTSTSPTNALVGKGFFVQGLANTLDVQNEWFYNKTTKKLRIYSTTSPTNVQIPIKDTLVYTGQRDYITFDGVDFVGSNKFNMIMSCSHDLTIQNCTFDYAGRDALWAYQNCEANSGVNFVFSNNTINHTNNNGIVYATGFYGAHIVDNTFTNIGMQAGMGADGSDGSNGTMEAIQVKSAKAIIEYNTFINIGYIPINTLNDSCTVRYNFITNFDATKMDGGGIYTWNGYASGGVATGTNFTGNKAYNNIIAYASGATALDGTGEAIPLVHGIYIDANTNNWEIYNNTCVGLGYGGGYNYTGSSNNNWHGNTFYNNGVNQFLLIDQRSASTGTVPTVGNRIVGNLFISKASTQLTSKFTTIATMGTLFGNFGQMDSNYYARPINDNATSNYIQLIVGSTGSNYSITTWKIASGVDVHSNRSTTNITDVNNISIEYNATKLTVVRALPYKYIDMLGNIYNGTITLDPFTSAVLIKTGVITGGTTPSFPKVSHNNIVH